VIGVVVVIRVRTNTQAVDVPPVIINVGHVNATKGKKEVVVVALIVVLVLTNQVMILGPQLVRNVTPAYMRAMVRWDVRPVPPGFIKRPVAGHHVGHVPPANIRPVVRRDVQSVLPVYIRRLFERRHVQVAPMVGDQTVGLDRAPDALPANTIPVILVRVVPMVGDQTLAQHHAPNAMPANTIPTILVTTVMQAMVRRQVHQAKQVVGLVPKARVLYQEAHARHVLRANTKTKLLKALVNYVLRVNI
jgi:hypothetical protein